MVPVPFVCLYDQLDRAFSSLQVENMKSVEHEDDEMNNDFFVDPLADPRYDKLDLFNMCDGDQRDAIMNASPSFVAADGDDDYGLLESDASKTSSESGSGE